MANADPKKLKTINIVIQETGEEGGKGFNVYMSGDKDRLVQQGGITEGEMTPAEFWGYKLFGMVVKVLKEAKAVKAEMARQ